MEVGQRLPLGVGATGQALYATTSDLKRRAAAKANAAWMAEYNYSPTMAEELAEDFKDRGYALNPSIPVQGMSAVALPIQLTTGQTLAAVGIGAINERMSMERIETVLLPLLKSEVTGLADKFDLLEAQGIL